ncbi:thiol S-methyltransferase TMT1A-like [Macrobrachium rosenbergii]|uniref:thiol S-methyltransferase TMT1A-like n=1 Tax=Macrobrachium rosenbergii TaxID=79674 RepID=UPI0034D60117
MDTLTQGKVFTEDIARYMVEVSDFVKTHPRTSFYGAGALAITVLSYTFGKDVKQRIFVWINSKADQIKDPKYEEYRKHLVAPLKDLESHDPELRKEKSIRILEIGVGCGNNLKNYPEGSHLVLVDPNPHFGKYFTEKLTGNLKIKPEDIIVSMGEEMDMVPDASVDAVVVSLVLCSVTDVAKVMQQVYRVLVPGGKFLFIEHIREWDTKKYRARRALQSLLTATRIWPFLFEGCSLNRDPLPAIEAAGFSQVNVEYFYAPILYTLFKLCSPHVIGEATK